MSGSTPFDNNSFLENLDWLRMSTRVEPALEALNLICGDRQKEYGGIENFTRLAERWSQRFGRQVAPWEICLLMIDLKLSRLQHHYKRDSVVDIIGYACLLVELHDAGGENKKTGQEDTSAEARKITDH